MAVAKRQCNGGGSILRNGSYGSRYVKWHVTYLSREKVALKRVVAAVLQSRGGENRPAVAVAIGLLTGRFFRSYSAEESYYIIRE